MLMLRVGRAFNIYQDWDGPSSIATDNLSQEKSPDSSLLLTLEDCGLVITISQTWPPDAEEHS